MKKVSRGNCSVVPKWIMFCEMIRYISRLLFPFNSEVALKNPVTNPIKAHIDCLRSMLLDCIVCNSQGYEVVGDQGCWGPQMGQFIRGDLKWAGLFRVVKESPRFGLCWRRHELTHYLTINMYGIGSYGVRASREVETSYCLRPCFGHRKVGRITCNSELYARLVEANSGFWVDVVVVD
jgi:hypothetical protein